MWEEKTPAATGSTAAAAPNRALPTSGACYIQWRRGNFWGFRSKISKRIQRGERGSQERAPSSVKLFPGKTSNECRFNNGWVALLAPYSLSAFLCLLVAGFCGACFVTLSVFFRSLPGGRLVRARIFGEEEGGGATRRTSGGVRQRGAARLRAGAVCVVVAGANVGAGPNEAPFSWPRARMFASVARCFPKTWGRSSTSGRVMAGSLGNRRCLCLRETGPVIAALNVLSQVRARRFLLLRELAVLLGGRAAPGRPVNGSCAAVVLGMRGIFLLRMPPGISRLLR